MTARTASYVDCNGCGDPGPISVTGIDEARGLAAAQGYRYLDRARVSADDAELYQPWLKRVDLCWICADRWAGPAEGVAYLVTDQTVGVAVYAGRGIFLGAREVDGELVLVREPMERADLYGVVLHVPSGFLRDAAQEQVRRLGELRELALADPATLMQPDYVRER